MLNLLFPSCFFIASLKPFLWLIGNILYLLVIGAMVILHLENIIMLCRQICPKCVLEFVGQGRV